MAWCGNGGRGELKGSTQRGNQPGSGNQGGFPRAGDISHHCQDANGDSKGSLGNVTETSGLWFLHRSVSLVWVLTSLIFKAHLKNDYLAYVCLL